MTRVLGSPTTAASPWHVLALYTATGADRADLVLAPWWWLALVPIGALLVVVGATSLPARLATRIPAADALRYE